MLSGEWAAAIHYDGIGTGEGSMWLTDKFIEPSWETNSDFEIDTLPDSWNDPNNPVNGSNAYLHDTGQSVIANDEVEITIDFEMVDLGEGEFSPLAYREPGGPIRIRRSERYVLLQTYTITNITQSPIENLQFYQMLHGHPADEGNAVVYSVYDDTAHEDPLEDYVPYNDMHCEEGSIYAGNFRYDITQWNNPHDPDAEKRHRDWIGFSSTIEPDFIENGILHLCSDFAGDSCVPTGNML